MTWNWKPASLWQRLLAALKAVGREGCTNILAAADLNARQVAILQGDNAEEYLQRANLGALIVPRPSFETALRELSSGQHDAVVIQKLLALQLMQKAGLTNLVMVGPPLKDFTQRFCFAVRKGDAELLAALNEGLAIVMADGTYRALHAKWFSALEALGRTKSRIVVGGDSDYPPYEFLDRNGQPAGYWIAKNGWRNLRVSEQSVFSVEYCYAVPHGNDELLSHFDEGLAALKASGEYRRIQTEWLGPYEGSGMLRRTVVKYYAE